MDETPNIDIPADSLPVEAPAVDAAPEAAPEVAQAPVTPDVTEYEQFKAQFSDKLPEGMSAADYYKLAYGKDAPVADAPEAPAVEEAPAPEEAVEAASAPAEELVELEIPDAPEAPEVDEAALQAKFDGWMDALDNEGPIDESVMGEMQAHFNATPEMIEIFKLGREAKRQQAQASAAASVGGTDNLNEILQWSASNLSEAERATANEGLRGPQSAFVLQGLQARMQQSQSKIAAAKKAEPTASGREQVSSTAKTVIGFSSQHDVAAAMADPRYGTDTTYTNWVYKRIEKTVSK